MRGQVGLKNSKDEKVWGQMKLDLSDSYASKIFFQRAEHAGFDCCHSYIYNSNL